MLYNFQLLLRKVVLRIESILLVLFSLASMGCVAQPKGQSVKILCPKATNFEKKLACNEVQRYIYLRTGKVISLEKSGTVSKKGNLIVIKQLTGHLANGLVTKTLEEEGIDTLQKQEYVLKTIRQGNRKILLIIGGDPIGTLYGAYRFAEHLGIRFGLDGDLVPDQRIRWQMPQINEVRRPLFHLRGILPFHDFPEGPDWWNEDAYKAIISQLPKLGMNFIGLHTYPQRPHDGSVEAGWDAEPTVWIGTSGDVNNDGSVKNGYPASYANTLRNGDWGYYKKYTSDYAFGASMLFDKDAYGPDVIEAHMPQPNTPQGVKAVFNRTGHLLNEAFTWAHKLGVKTTVGTETPLTLPRCVRNRLKKQGVDPRDSTAVEQAYEGMFTWIKHNYPLDYYWFWTPEDWTWEGTTKEDVERTYQDLRQAMRAAKNVEAPFILATSGWVLGPAYNRTLFDDLLPKNMPMSAINRQVGFTPNEPTFADVQDRPTWIIPWLEDDPALTQPQLWVGRIRRDAAQALAYKATGLIGIHWRTRRVGPMVQALARAGWSQVGWNRDYSSHIKTNASKSYSTQNHKEYHIFSTRKFYAQWASQEFGTSSKIADKIAGIFSNIDSFDPVFSFQRLSKHTVPTHIPRPTDWVNGPGGIRPDSISWQKRNKQYAFVHQMERFRSLIHGKGNKKRFDYWLNSFKYLRAIGKLRTIWGRFDKALDNIKPLKDTSQQRQIARKKLLPVREEMIEQLHNVYNYLLSTVSTTGDLGTIDNWERHIMPMLLEKPGKQLEGLAGEKLPAKAKTSLTYTGSPRLIVPVARMNITEGEVLTIRLIILSRHRPKNVALYWRPLGDGGYHRIPATHLNRGVYSAVVPENATHDSFEYYIKADIGPKTESMYYPVTAPDINQTVVTTAPE